MPPDAYGNIKTAGRLLQAMRGAGFTPVMELDVLVGGGLSVSLFGFVSGRVGPDRPSRPAGQKFAVSSRQGGGGSGAGWTRGCRRWRRRRL